MSLKYSPFAALTDTKFSPWSRIIHNAFERRLWDTLCVFSGRIGLFQIKQAGLFDYATAFLLVGIAHLLSRSWQAAKVDKRYFALTAPLAAVHLVSLVARWLVASMCTFFLSPIVAVVHCYYVVRYAEKLERKALALECKVPGSRKTVSLNSYLKMQGVGLDEVKKITLKKRQTDATVSLSAWPKDKSSSQYRVSFFIGKGNPSWGRWVLDGLKKITGSTVSGEHQQLYQVNTLSERNRNALGALLVLNSAGITAQVEQDNEMDSDEINGLMSSVTGTAAHKDMHFGIV